MRRRVLTPGMEALGVSRGIRAQHACCALIVALSLSSVGCFGRFELVRKVYAFNKRVDPDKWIQWGAFVVMNFVPVYGAAAFVDAVFANSVEFWSGKNPITAEVIHRSEGPNGEVASLHLHPDGHADLSVVGEDGREHRLRLEREPTAIAVYSDAGVLLGRVSSKEGRVALVDR